MYAGRDDLRLRMGSSRYEEIYGDTEASLADLMSSEAEINGIIGYRYSLPVTGLQSLALLKDWTLTLSEERAAARPCGSEFSEKIKLRAEQVRKYLKMVHDGNFSLPDAGERNEGTQGAGYALSECETPVFGRDAFRGF